TRQHPPASAGLASLPQLSDCPLTVTASVSDRGVLVHAPLADGEMIYGLGLQFQSFQQRGHKKKLRVNADPAMDTGDSHAPVPFYVTTRGYGVFVDTARYATFYLGDTKQAPSGLNGEPQPKNAEVLVEIPRAAGADVYVFGGPSLREAVQRYNLFSGGGPLPPRWGLGFWYRGQSDYSQTNVLELATEFRRSRIPCDVLGLEPGWQTHAYSCSFVWSKKFPEPADMLRELGDLHFHLNLWEHAFVHPSSPIYAALLPLSGSYEVWGGLVPDFLQPQARSIFANFHAREHVALGVAGYKGDECDNSDFTGGWSFPELSRFPSGADGEQMHSLFGLRYQDALTEAFDERKQRTYGLIRSSGALAAPYPYALYSDLYSHRQFVHSIPQLGFCGLLWAPEVRDSANPTELLRRLESAAFSPLAMVNAWYLRNPPWKQVNRQQNNAGHFADGWEKTEAQCRSVMELRMRFVPWLQAAFARYHHEGLPPFRALVMDFPNDEKSRAVDDEYIMGDGLLVAPIIVNDRGSERSRRSSTAETPGSEGTRTVYLPPGDWQDFWTNAKYHGGREIEVQVPVEQIPLFVPSGTILPLAEPTLHTDDPNSYRLTALIYGDGSRGATLYEDDGAFVPKLSTIKLSWDSDKKSGKATRDGVLSSYRVVEWKQQ
ncbi:MAG TPA: TIM-barrel domain-containing protein, partial [Verrucomicrobiae bacterium]|nr:TIM-barrel domain-containing protein [Verrucomicrobiae bacterium]